MHGSVYANWAVRDCDLLVAIGVRFDDRVTGKLEAFAQHAKIIHVDVDASELNKNKPAHIPIVADAKDFLSARASAAEETRLGKRIAFAIMLAMAILTQFREISLWRLIELKMELLIQCAPVFLAPLHWGGMRAGPGLSGLVVGAGITVYAFTLGETRIEGFHTGVLALAVNLAIAGGGSLLLPAPQSSSSSIPSPP